MPSLKQIQKQHQQQKISPQQLLVLRLLNTSVDQLEALVNDECMSNVLLDPTDNATDNEMPAEKPETQLLSDEDDGYEANDEYYEPTYNDGDKRDDPVNAPDPTRLLAAETTFADDLKEQLEYKRLNEQQKTVALHIIGSLDDDGRLNGDLAIIANDLYSQGIPTNMKEVEEMVEVVQSLDPPGVAARSTQECLLLQLRRRPQDEACKTATKIIEKYFELFKTRDYMLIRQRLGIGEEPMNDAINLIKSLSLNLGHGESASYITPDVVVRQTIDGLHVELTDGNMPDIRFDEENMQLMASLEQSGQQLTPSEKKALDFYQKQKQSADELIGALRQRQATMLKVVRAIVSAQRQYFTTGRTEDKQPLLQKDIAEQTGYDASTISRIVNAKYVQTDFGIIPLDQCFSTGYVDAQGENVSTEAIKALLRQAIDNEDKANPLTDKQLMETLNRKGFPVARRTVANYRKEMGYAARYGRRIATAIALIILAGIGQLMAQEPMSYYDSIIYEQMHSRHVKRAQYNAPKTEPAKESEPTEEQMRERAKVDSIIGHEPKNSIDSLYDSLRCLPSETVYGSLFFNNRVKPMDRRHADSLPDEVLLRLAADSSGFCFPAKGAITSPYGWRWERAHRGIDIRLREGDPVYCAFDGVVRVARPLGAYGNVVVVRHYNGLETIYGHLSKILVKPYEKIKAGCQLGKGGSTGRATGPHLHFEVRFHYEPFDPEWILDFENYAMRTQKLHLDKSYFGIYRPSIKGQSYKADESHIAEHEAQEPEPNAPEEKPHKGAAHYYIVKDGDTLTDIAQKFGLTVKQLRQYNKKLRTLQEGDRIRVK